MKSDYHGYNKGELIALLKLSDHRLKTSTNIIVNKESQVENLQKKMAHIVSSAGGISRKLAAVTGEMEKVKDTIQARNDQIASLKRLISEHGSL